MIRIPAVLLIILLTSPTAARGADPVAFPVIQSQQGLTLHKEMGILPFTHCDEYSGVRSEVIFQISAKYSLFGTRFYSAYRQISFWQAYDTGNSSPFRDTNYNPEVFYRFNEIDLGSRRAGADAGFEHESNGQLVEKSRSWNLLYVTPHLRGSNWLVRAKLRYRIPEKAKRTPLSPLGDDNPDITDYLGYSDLHVYCRWPNGHQIHALVRGVLGTGKGNLSLNYSAPFPGSDDSFMLFRLFYGYGESLLDYRTSITRIGVGILFNR